MLLLVTDTSGKQGSVALARADSINAADAAVIEEVPLAGGTFSAQLVPQIAALLAKHGFTKAAIDAFIVVSGPGSFTGLRVGLAAIKALAETLQKPIVPVSLLEAVALAARADGGYADGGYAERKILAALDAGRDGVYAGEYQGAGTTTQVVQEQLLSRAEFLSLAKELTVATPDHALAATAKNAGLALVLVDRPGAAMIASLGLRKLQAGETVDPAQLEANYIRRSDAEIFAKINS
jgi:tRNA threonylcarbamoyladenosine biosynthesis protein TsaB